MNYYDTNIYYLMHAVCRLKCQNRTPFTMYSSTY